MAGGSGRGRSAGQAARLRAARHRAAGRRGARRRAGSALALALALTLAFGGPALADTAALRACVGDTGQADSCMGLPLDPCFEAAGAEAETTAGIVACIIGATEAWDDLLNEAYREVMAEAREADATGDVLAPDLTREATLRNAQRAWIVFRDADCLAQRARWGQGSLGGVSAANCAMVLTARRAAELLAMKAP